MLSLAVVSASAADDFVWGTATAAYQVEGSRHVAGRQMSVWDAFDSPSVHSAALRATKPNGQPNVYQGENASVCDDDYVRYNESVALTRHYGFKAARMSIAWPRVMTYKPSSEGALQPPTWERNEEGIQHYRAVLSAYGSAGIKVALTMWHWDLPLALEDHAAKTANSSAWLQPWIADAFAEYAALLVGEFAEWVTWWITLNEPLTIVENGYAGSGPHAPGRCSDRATCWAGDDLVEPYVAAKNLILAHARAFRAWEAGGSPGLGCGITLNGDWREPFTSSAESSGFNFTSKEPIGTPSSNGWLYNVGWGIRKLVTWYNARYPGLSFLVTENGWGNASSTVAKDVLDFERCNFYRDYIGNLSAAAAANVSVGAYFAWSLMDNYEWADGFSTRFGLTYVNYATQKRTPKLSSAWFAKHVTPLKQLPTDGAPFPPCDVASLVGQVMAAQRL